MYVVTCNETRAPIANFPNGVQLEGIPFHGLQPGPCSIVRMRPGTDRQKHRQTDTQTAVANIYISPRLRLTRNVIKDRRCGGEATGSEDGQQTDSVSEEVLNADSKAKNKLFRSENSSLVRLVEERSDTLGEAFQHGHRVAEQAEAEYERIQVP